MLPEGGEHAWLLVQFGGDDADEVREQAERFRDWLVDEKGYAPERIAVHGMRNWAAIRGRSGRWREGGLGATAFPPGDKNHWPGWEDSAVPPERVGDYIRDLKKLYARYDYEGAMYGHFGQGCVHSRVSFDLRHPDGIKKYREFLNEAADLVVSYGGSLSGEHGDGQQRAEFLYKQYGPELVEAMREFNASGIRSTR